MSTTDLLSFDLEAIVKDELASGEQIAWMGQPIPSHYARMSLPIILFGIPWTAFAIFWIAGASGFKIPDFSNGSGFFPLFGIPFVLIGLCMLSSPYWMRRKALRTVYVITDRRAIVLDGHGWRGFTIRSFDPERLTSLQRTQYPDGSGNLIFERLYQNNHDGNGQGSEVGFRGIADVKEVEALVQGLVKRSKPSAA